MRDPVAELLGLDEALELLAAKRNAIPQDSHKTLDDFMDAEYRVGTEWRDVMRTRLTFEERLRYEIERGKKSAAERHSARLTTPMSEQTNADRVECPE